MPPPGGGGGGGGGAGGGGGGGNPHFTCPTGDHSWAGDTAYIGAGLKAAPLRGNVGCVDSGPLATRPTVEKKNGATQDATNIYGCMENGFTDQNHACLGSTVVPPGLDTKLAEAMLHHVTGCEGSQILDACGGHAVPYHYHERMSCLYSADATTQHSTRIGTALDGHGIYGKFIGGGEEPTDLDGCGGRVGVTPDSGGAEVYYYPVTDYAPFTLACFGSKATYPVTVEQCKLLYPDSCKSAPTVITTGGGSGEYIVDCPCFNGNHSNVAGQGVPGFLTNCLANCTSLPAAGTDGGSTTAVVAGAAAGGVVALALAAYFVRGRRVNKSAAPAAGEGSELPVTHTNAVSAQGHDSPQSSVL